MSKFIVLMVFVAGLCGPAGAASIVQTPSDTTGATHAAGATNDLPSQVNELRSEVKALQGQVGTLQNANMEQNDAVWPNSWQESFSGENSSILPGRGGR
jgi:hypothetical protein